MMEPIDEDEDKDKTNEIGCFYAIAELLKKYLYL